MTAIVDILRRARARLAVPGRWTRGAYGRTADGKSSLARFERCVCWCAMGAVRAEVYQDATLTNPTVMDHAVLEPLTRTLIERGYLHGLSVFNDAQTSVGPVLALYDETIARLEAAAEGSAAL